MKKIIITIICVITFVALFYLFSYLFLWYFPTKISSEAMNKYYYEWEPLYGEEKAREMTVSWLKQRLLVRDAGISGYTICIRYWTAFPECISTAPPGMN